MIIGFVGKRGSGKTLSCVREIKGYHDKGYTIYSNIKLLKIPYKKYTLKDIEEFYNTDTQIKNCVILLDEAHIFLDSRTGMFKRNRVITYFITQTRKRNVKVLYTTQFQGQVDKRLRENTDIVIICQNRGGNYIYNNVIFGDNRIRRYRFKPEKYYEYYDTEEIVNL